MPEDITPFAQALREYYEEAVQAQFRDLNTRIFTPSGVVGAGAPRPLVSYDELQQADRQAEKEDCKTVPSFLSALASGLGNGYQTLPNEDEVSRSEDLERKVLDSLPQSDRSRCMLTPGQAIVVQQSHSEDGLRYIISHCE